MTPKRGDSVAPPAIGTEYDVRYVTNDAIKGWKDLCTQEPGNTNWAWTQMRQNPGCCNEGPTSRHFQLKRELATGLYANRELPQFQIEVLSGARVWYLLDADKRVCWLKHAGRGHPKKTE
ncbi:hypothetical protein [Streptomyces sp. NPDC058268]|uniref:hypothetical protein n=1 Tax=Streptomyces sp. NPDC058268 TaxID=3346413 RepID=UPI0036EC6472